MCLLRRPPTGGQLLTLFFFFFFWIKEMIQIYRLIICWIWKWKVCQKMGIWTCQEFIKTERKILNKEFGSPYLCNRLLHRQLGREEKAVMGGLCGCSHERFLFLYHLLLLCWWRMMLMMQDAMIKWRTYNCFMPHWWCTGDGGLTMVPWAHEMMDLWWFFTVLYFSAAGLIRGLCCRAFPFLLLGPFGFCAWSLSTSTTTKVNFSQQ